MTPLLRKIILFFLPFALVVTGYAAWYTSHRAMVIERNYECRKDADVATSPKMRAPDGTMVSVVAPCILEPIPPRLQDLVRGKTMPSNIPDHMKVAPYTFWDVLLGRYSLSPELVAPCDQSATTTNCSLLMLPPAGI